MSHTWRKKLTVTTTCVLSEEQQGSGGGSSRPRVKGKVTSTIHSNKAVKASEDLHLNRTDDEPSDECLHLILHILTCRFSQTAMKWVRVSICTVQWRSWKWPLRAGWENLWEVYDSFPWLCVLVWEWSQLCDYLISPDVRSEAAVCPAVCTHSCSSHLFGPIRGLRNDKMRQMSCIWRTGHLKLHCWTPA